MWLGAQMAMAFGWVSQPWRTQYWRGPGSDATRARPGCTSMTVVPFAPMAPATSMRRACVSGSSATTTPSRRTTAFSAAPPEKAIGARAAVPAAASSSMAQSPGFMKRRKVFIGALLSPGPYVMARWRTSTRACSLNSRASHSARYTERCWPPVQPIATVR